MRLTGRVLLLLLVASGVIAVLTWLNLQTYSRLTDEAQVARLTFQPVAPQQFRVEVRSGDFCDTRTFMLYGDEWRIDAQFLKWKPWANLLGLDARYRLDRLSGRYRDVAQENESPHIAWALSEPSLLESAIAETGWLAGLSPLDTVFGSSVYQPIEPDYEYTVYRGQSGLLVRKQPLALIRRDGDSLVIPIENPCVMGQATPD
ncbi:hypothetical protein DFR30_1954 [Thiogranum longum]|uniref:Uncharacterized protein n=1 Tax=Thiogranum longum TaxID=1537524 RepID=A0A4R1HDA9_9GAMM|nr:hypothetical protein [Thiogranum longum]TCK18671.1 hypothetical protein DFR30_1954 [Thiogranum longum]